MDQGDWRRWLPLALAGVLLVGTLLLGVVPGLQRQRSLRERVEQKDEELRELERLSQRRETLAQEHQVLQARFGPEVGLDPETELLPRALSEIEAVCRASGLEIANLQPAQPEVSQEGYARVGLQLTVRGSLDGVARQFLYHLRQASPVMNVDRMDLRRSGRDEGQFEGQFLVSAYGLLTEEAQQTLRSEEARRRRRRPGTTATTEVGE